MGDLTNIFANIANLVFLSMAIISVIGVIVYNNRASSSLKRITDLEQSLKVLSNKEQTLSNELSLKEKEIERYKEESLKISSKPANVFEGKHSLRKDLVAFTEESVKKTVPIASLSPKQKQEIPEKNDKKKLAEKNSREIQKINELEFQVLEARKQLENAQKQLKQRDSDVISLKDELDNLYRDIAENKVEDNNELKKSDAQKSSNKKQDNPFKAEVAKLDSKQGNLTDEGVQLVTPSEFKSVEDTPVYKQLEKSLEETKKKFDDLDRSKRDAQTRANLAELELRKSNERLQKIDKRFREMLEKLLNLERDQRKHLREIDSYEKMYLGLKGKFDVARDTLSSFRERFGVDIPVEAGVPLYADLEDVIEYEAEEALSPRPKSANSHEEFDN